MGLAALIGLALGVAVLRLLLGSWRPTLALAVAVPASMLATFSAFHLCGVPLDVVSLAGLALAAGMLVDSSVVVLESIATARARGESDPEVAPSGGHAADRPAGGGGLPRHRRGLPAAGLSPGAGARLLRRPGVRHRRLARRLAALLADGDAGARPRPAGRRRRGGGPPAARAYLRLLDGALARPAVPVLAALAAAAVALLALAVLPRELVPNAETRDLVVRYRLPADLAPEAARRLGGDVEARTAAVADAERPAASPGSPPSSEPRRGRRRGDRAGRSPLRRSGERRRGAGRSCAPPSPACPTSRPGWSRGRAPSCSRSSGPAGAWRWWPRPPPRSGPRPSPAGWRSACAAPACARRACAATATAPALLLSWDVPRLAALGADRDQLEQQVRAALGEQTAGRVRIDGVEPDIVVRPTQQEDPALLPVLATSRADGPGVVPLGALARFDAGARPPVLEREDGLPAVRLAFDGALGNRDPEALLRGVARAADEQVAPGGQALELRRAFGQLRLALSLSLLLVFLTVAALYESLTTPLVVMTTVPVALGGALGLLALDRADAQRPLLPRPHPARRHRGQQRHRAGPPDRGPPPRRLRGRRGGPPAGAERYRPILMTTLTTVAGMLPLALLGGEGVELRRSLALAVIGGMTLSTFASLLLVPVLYRICPQRTA